MIALGRALVLDMEDKRRRLRESNRLRIMEENVLYLMHCGQQGNIRSSGVH